jgi:hypothetical protein
MRTKVKTRERTATAGLREEVEEDVKNARAAVADLKTTTQQNWWERHEGYSPVGLMNAALTTTPTSESRR